MTFRQIQANVKNRRKLIVVSMIMIAASLAIFAVTMLNFSFTLPVLAVCAIAYAMSMAGGLSILYALNYTKKNTKCVKCRRQINIADFMAMDDYRCPHCGYDAAADDRIW